MSGDSIPTGDQVRAQLQKMLATAVFSTRPQQANLLAFTVQQTLQGNEITEKFLRQHVFPSPPYKPESNIARRTIGLVRDLLAEYYETQGKSDLVLIGFPTSPEGTRVKHLPGDAYRPTFSYNPGHDLGKKCAIAGFYLRHGSGPSLGQAIEGFAAILELDESYVPAYIGLAEAVCAMVTHRFGAELKRETLENAIRLATDAVRFCPTSWHAHAALGAALFCSRKMVDAERAFETALQIDNEKTNRYRWHHAFVFTCKDHAEALKLIRSTTESGDPVSLAICGLYLYTTRQYEEAEQTLTNAMYLDIHCWIAHLGLVLVYIATQRFADALIYFECLREDLAEIKEPDTMPGLAVICAYRHPTISVDKREKILRSAQAVIEKKYFMAPGLQNSLVALALGDLDKSIEHLESAWSEYEILAFWLKAWPLFDPLRGHPRFEALLHTIDSVIAPHHPV